MLIRGHEERDWCGIWEILEPVFRAGESYAHPLDISEDDARRAWTAEGRESFVAEDESTGQIVGTYYLRPNPHGPDALACNCGYAVAASARGQGVASLMCEHSQAEACSRGYRAMQFNLVAASNVGAVRLWTKMGFDIVRTLPGAFRHPRLGFVDAFVMSKQLIANERASRKR